MAKKGWTWGFSPKSLPKPKMPDDLKKEIQSKADELVDQFLNPNLIKKPPKKPRWNYIIGIHTKWHRSFFYFIATFRSPSPRAISPIFEAPFTRLEVVGMRKFNMAYMRHTGLWWEIRKGLSMEKCFEAIKEEGIFQPASP